MKAFAAARGITFPLVSDTGSVIIREYGLLNETVDASTRSFGVPHPGTFILDREGVVRERYFETAYQERYTAAGILSRQGVTPLGPAMTVDTPHLVATAAVSDDTVAPGTRVALVAEIEPKPGMHVYAPGKHSYRVVRMTLDPQPWLRTHEPTYPRPEIYHFKPLDERVEVFIKPFRITQDVTVLATPAAQKALAGRTSLTISGRLEYQACDEKVCYLPQSVPVQWTLGLGGLVR